MCHFLGGGQKYHGGDGCNVQIPKGLFTSTMGDYAVAKYDGATSAMGDAPCFLFYPLILTILGREINSMMDSLYNSLQMGIINTILYQNQLYCTANQPR